MNCPQCIAARAGFLGAYWVTLTASALMVLASVLLWFWSRRQNKNIDPEAAKYEMLRDS